MVNHFKGIKVNSPIFGLPLVRELGPFKSGYTPILPGFLYSKSKINKHPNLKQLNIKQSLYFINRSPKSGKKK